MTSRLLVFATKLRGSFASTKKSREFDDEIRAHLRLLAERFIAQGMSPEEAAATARRQFGNTTLLQEDQRELRILQPLEMLWRDMRFGARQLRRNSSFTIIAVLSLAFGIGANTAIFAVTNSVLLQPLPYPDSNRLEVVWAFGEQQNSEPMQVSFPDFQDLKSQAPAFAGLDALYSDQWELTRIQAAGAVQGLRVTPTFFQTLGVQPILGRSFTAKDGKPGKDEVVVLSQRAWRDRFSSDPAILGRVITLDGRQCVVIDVLPPSFRFNLPVTPAFTISDVEIWRPLNSAHELAGRRDIFTYEVLGRLKSGVDRAQAQMQLDTIGGRLQNQYPATNHGRTFRVISLHDQVVGDVRVPLLVLLCATGLVLLLATANLANLLLARGVAREKEVLIRAALGASRSRLVRQFLTESLLLSLLGTVGGLVFACWTTDTLLQWGDSKLSIANASATDTSVLLFALGLALVTATLFGAAPAFFFTRPNLQQELSSGGRISTSRRQRKAQDLFLVCEVAFAFLLLVGAGLLAISFRSLLAVNPGFRSANMITFQVTAPPDRYTHKQDVVSFYQRLRESLAALPGARAVAVVSVLPLSGADVGSDVHVQNHPLGPGKRPQTAGWQMVLPGYFQEMGIPLIRGRDFNDLDIASGQRSAIISESLAHSVFPGEDPVGQKIAFGSVDPQNPVWDTVIGVVADVRHLSLNRAPLPRGYDLFGQSWDRTMCIAVRGERNGSPPIDAIRSQVAALDKKMPLDSVRTMDDYVSRSVAPQRFLLAVVSIFAAFALLIAVVGIYGVFAYVVGLRTREMGIRMVLGAQPGAVRRMVLRKAAKVASIGIAIGLAAALVLTRFLASELYGVSARDPFAFAAVGLALLVAALGACYIPAQRVSSVDAIESLREM